MAKKSRVSKQKRRSRTRRRTIRGGGYTQTLNPSIIHPGNQVIVEYAGPGYDSPPIPVRHGYLADIGSLRNPGGLPGVSPSMRGGGIVNGGANQLGSGGPVVPQASVNPLAHPPVGGSLIDLGTDPAARLPPQVSSGRPWTGPLYHGGAGSPVPPAPSPNPGPVPPAPPAPSSPGSVPGAPKAKSKKSKKHHGGAAIPGPASTMLMAPTLPSPAQAAVQAIETPNKPIPMQSGGRWGAMPSLGPLNPTNGVGTIGSPFVRVPCETGTLDPLNRNPMGIQSITTAPLPYPGSTNYASALRGGKRSRKQRSRKQKKSRKQSGGRFVGDVGSMAYYAPTAGYGNYPMNPVPANNPGVLMQVGYPARHFNPACVSTS